MHEHTHTHTHIINYPKTSANVKISDLTHTEQSQTRTHLQDRTDKGAKRSILNFWCFNEFLKSIQCLPSLLPFLCFLKAKQHTAGNKITMYTCTQSSSFWKQQKALSTKHFWSFVSLIISHHSPNTVLTQRSTLFWGCYLGGICGPCITCTPGDSHCKQFRSLLCPFSCAWCQCSIQFNLFTAMLANVSLGKQPIKVPNLKSLNLMPHFAWAPNSTSIKTNSIKSRFVTGPSNILFASLHVSTFQPGNFTGWGSEGVKMVSLQAQTRKKAHMYSTLFNWW